MKKSDFDLDKDSYVYFHYRKDNGKLFYIGKGRNKRYLQTKDRNIYWKRIVNKYDFYAEIVCNGLSDTDAFTLEQILIITHGLEGLANLTLGGVSTRGYKRTEEEKKKMSAVRKRMYHENINGYKDHVDAHIRKMHERQRNDPAYIKKLTDASKAAYAKLTEEEKRKRYDKNRKPPKIKPSKEYKIARKRKSYGLAIIINRQYLFYSAKSVCNFLKIKINKNISTNCLRTNLKESGHYFIDGLLFEYFDPKMKIADKGLVKFSEVGAGRTKVESYICMNNSVYFSFAQHAARIVLGHKATETTGEWIKKIALGKNDNIAFGKHWRLASQQEVYEKAVENLYKKDGT